MLDEQKLSLGEKFQKYVEFKTKNGVKPSAPFLNKSGPVVYFVVFLGVFYLGLTEILPRLYCHPDDVFLKINQTFGWIIGIEMMMNWFCIRYVDSCYKPSVHGTKPTSDRAKNSVTITTGNEADDNFNDRQSYQGIGSDVNSNGVTKRKVFRMLVATSLPNAEGKVERKAFDYWSWTPCIVCQRLRPPRCHHCVLCKTCVLKRDHHCYFAGACIGVNNQRHFIVFLFWTFTGCLYSFLHMLPYIYTDVLPIVSYVDFIPPITFIRALFGYQTLFMGFKMCLAWFLTCFVAFSATHLYDSFFLVFKSQTTFEHSNDMKITDKRTNQGRLRSVFGDYWLLNFILPCHWLFRPAEDPVLWPTVKL